MVNKQKVDTRWVVTDDKGNRIFRSKSEEEVDRFITRYDTLEPEVKEKPKKKKIWQRKSKKSSVEESTE